MPGKKIVVFTSFLSFAVIIYTAFFADFTVYSVIGDEKSEEVSASVTVTDTTGSYPSKAVNLHPTSADGCSSYGNVFVCGKNADVKTLLSKKSNVEGCGKTVVVICSHSTENYSLSDSFYRTDMQYAEDGGIKRVAKQFVGFLKENGVSVIYDFTSFDLPFFNGAFERSGKLLSERFSDESIGLIIDLHRDVTVEENLTGLRPIAPYGEKTVSQIATVVPGGNESSLIFALKLTELLETAAPDITRPIFLTDDDYGYGGKTDRVIIAVGSQSNTEEESIASVSILAKAVADIVSGN